MAKSMSKIDDIALPADPNDLEDFDVSGKDLRKALMQRAMRRLEAIREKRFSAPERRVKNRLRGYRKQSLEVLYK